MKVPVFSIVLVTLITALVLWAEPSWSATCHHPSKELKLDASFFLDGAPMQIRVGNDLKKKMTATVYAQGRCQAVCEVTNFEQDRNQATGGGNPLSLELSCRSVGLAPLESRATLFWPEALGQKLPTLRFGTWLTGYRKAPLKVRLDTLTRPSSS